MQAANTFLEVGWDFIGETETPMESSWVWSRVSGGMNGDYRLIYFGEHQPVAWFYGKPYLAIRIRGLK